jgi:hypothetical protein
MSNSVVGILFILAAIAFISATVVGCVGRAEAVLAYNPGAPV